MGIYACPRCGNPNGWWSGNMRDIHDCPGPPPDTRKPWERSDWTCARARVDSDGMHCPEDKCADCPNRTRGVKVCGCLSVAQCHSPGTAQCGNVARGVAEALCPDCTTPNLCRKQGRLCASGVSAPGGRHGK